MVVLFDVVARTACDMLENTRRACSLARQHVRAQRGQLPSNLPATQLELLSLAPNYTVLLSLLLPQQDPVRDGSRLFEQK